MVEHSTAEVRVKRLGEFECESGHVVLHYVKAFGERPNFYIRLFPPEGEMRTLHQSDDYRYARELWHNVIVALQDREM
jgi:hypothetical protein